MKKDLYQDLAELRSKEKEADQYFNDLSDYVQEHIASRSGSINSFENLRDYAENLLRGDD